MTTSLTDGGCRSCGGSTGLTVADHVAEADPHVQYLTEVSAAVLYEPAGDPAAALAAHVAAADPHALYLLEADAAATYALATALPAHVAAGDPHPGYLLEVDAATDYGSIAFVEDQTGFATYADGLYTSGSPLALVGATPADLPNNAAVAAELELPTDVVEYWDGTVIPAVATEALVSCQFSFVADPASASWIDVWLNDGTDDLYRQTISLVKGAVAHEVIVSFLAPITASWITNGATPRVEAGVATDVYDISFLVARAHKVRTS